MRTSLVVMDLPRRCMCESCATIFTFEEKLGAVGAGMARAQAWV